MLRTPLLLWCLMASAVFADKPILLITPNGVFQSQVVNGVPGVWVPIEADVIVQGFNTGGPVPPVVTPPTDDPVVKQIATISKAVLKDKDEATAVASIVDSIGKLGLSPESFKQALEMSAPIADASLSANGRITEWSKQALVVSSNAAKLKAGVKSAFDIQQATLDSINTAASNPTAVATGEAINWTQIIAIIQMILELLKNLGIGTPQ